MARLTPEQIDAVNRERPPSEKVSTTPKCGARRTTRSSDLSPDAPTPTCTQPAGYGTDHQGFGYCKFHGGNTPAGRKMGNRAAVAKIVEEHRQQALTFGGSRFATENDLTPEEVLLEEVRRSVAMVRWIEERIGNWNIISLQDLQDLPRNSTDRDLAGLPQLNTETFKGTPTATDAQSWLIHYRDERNHMVKVAKLAIDSGVQERMVRIAEQQGEMLTLAIRAVLHALNLNPDQLALVPQVVPDILRQVSLGNPITINGELVPS